MKEAQPTINDSPSTRRFEAALKDIEELKAKIQRNDARGVALFERLKARYRALEKLEEKARERVSTRRAP